jgi:putative thiamine transport system substrate-binding protein
MFFKFIIIFFLLISKVSYTKEINFHAWGGSSIINDFIKDFSVFLDQKEGIKLNHIKITDTQTSVNLILEESKQETSKIDLIWVNGENFANLKQNNLLYGPLDNLENLKFMDLNDQTLTNDFGIRTEFYEIPWGRAQFSFLYDSQFVNNPPTDLKSLGLFINNFPGRFTYPKPPNFHGTTFLKQIMYELGFYETMQEVFDSNNSKHIGALESLISYLNTIHPNLWANGNKFPKSNVDLIKMLADRQILIAITFNPNEASTQIKQGILSKNVKTYTFEKGSIANTHFLAIPKYSENTNESIIAINYLISPYFQSLKLNPEIWGDPTVLDLSRMNDQDKNLFKYQFSENNLKQNKYNSLLEPHISWTNAIEEKWLQVYQ